MSPKFSAPLAAKLCVRPPKVLQVQERARGPLSPCQVWFWARISPGAWVAKNVEGPLLRAKFHPHRCNVSPLRGEKLQNRPLSKLNTRNAAGKKTQRFWPPQRRVKSEPKTKLGMVIEDLEHVLAPLKRFRV